MIVCSILDAVSHFWIRSKHCNVGIEKSWTCTDVNGGDQNNPAARYVQGGVHSAEKPCESVAFKNGWLSTLKVSFSLGSDNQQWQESHMEEKLLHPPP